MAYGVDRVRRGGLAAQANWKLLLAAAFRTVVWVFVAFFLLMALDRSGLLGQSLQDSVGTCGPLVSSSSQIAAIGLVVGGGL
jgi:hypothetical protein